MFFPRLRRHAKWMFLFLALVFALGFVGFGVGAGGVGVGDIFRDASGSGVPSISDAEKRVSENPRDAAAFRDLATAQQAAGNVDEAIDALESFVALRPKDADALRELAALYLTKAGEAQQRAQIAQLRAAYLAPATSIPALTQLGDKVLNPDPDHERHHHALLGRDPGGVRRGAERGGSGSRHVQADRGRAARRTRPSSSSSRRPRRTRATTRRRSRPTRPS